MSYAVTLEKVSCEFKSGTQTVRAVDSIDLNIQEGEFFTLLGPSGSGKTTCLRIIGGFQLPTSGHVKIHGQDVSLMPPYQRPVNTVFQDYALFPHMTVLDNVGYPLMIKGMNGAERKAQAMSMLRTVQLEETAQRKPAQLSGGQRQRIALARALISKPRVLLLDEPLGALDLKLREQMQSELKSLQRQLGITFIFVTHDQHEALSMSDRIGIFNRGKLEQIASAQEIYDRPASLFVAEFVGTANVLNGALAQRWVKDGAAMVRPENIQLTEPASAHYSGTVTQRQFFGSFARLHVRGEDGITLLADIDRSDSQLAQEGQVVHLSWRDDCVHALPGVSSHR